MKYYLIAGEASGDLHGSNLVKALFQADPFAEIRAWGGDLMMNAGADIVNHYKDTAVIGYANVIKNLGKLSRLMKECQNDIINYNPDVLILIDYPGFNLRIAKYVKKYNIKVFYYIAPKIWAWKKHRIKSVKKYVDRLYSILPFEIDFYKNHNYEIEYIGNPILDAIEQKLNKTELVDDFIQRHSLDQKPIVAVLPGSRKQEIKMLLPTMLKIQNDFSPYQFVISKAPSIDEEFYHEICGTKDVKLVHEDTYQLLKHADAALVASGTAALETALIGTPQVVGYKLGGGRLAFVVGKIVIRIPFVTLVNLIMGKEIIKELLQHQYTASNLKKELQKILPGGNKRDNMMEDYRKLWDKMGNPGASVRAAESIVSHLKNEKPNA